MAHKGLEPRATGYIWNHTDVIPATSVWDPQTSVLSTARTVYNCLNAWRAHLTVMTALHPAVSQLESTIIALRVAPPTRGWGRGMRAGCLKADDRAKERKNDRKKERKEERKKESIDRKRKKERKGIGQKTEPFYGLIRTVLNTTEGSECLGQLC